MARSKINGMKSDEVKWWSMRYLWYLLCSRYKSGVQAPNLGSGASDIRLHNSIRQQGGAVSESRIMHGKIHKYCHLFVPVTGRIYVRLISR